MRPDGAAGLGAERASRRSDLRAWLSGLLLSAAVLVAISIIKLGLSWAECSGEHQPFLGSAKQAFAVHGCLMRDAGPLIGLKQRLGIYDPRWRPVIR